MVLEYSTTLCSVPVAAPKTDSIMSGAVYFSAFIVNVFHFSVALK